MFHCSSLCLRLLVVLTFVEMKSGSIQENDILVSDRVYRYVGDSHLQFANISLKSLPLEEEVQKIQEIPESVLIGLKDIKDVSEFIERFLRPASGFDHKTGTDDIHLEYLQRGSLGSDELSSDESLLGNRLTKLPKLSSPAGCYPENQIIELQTHRLYNEIYFPSCVRLPRCSGCCLSQRLGCVPTKKSFTDISVLRVKYSNLDKKFVFRGFKVFRIEKHDNCSCECIQKEADCSAKQRFHQEECRCLCSNLEEQKLCRKEIHKVWDNDRCECRCMEVPLCSTNSVFNNQNCRCESTSMPSKRSKEMSNETNLSFKFIKEKNEETEVHQHDNKGIILLQPTGINPEIDFQLP